MKILLARPRGFCAGVDRAIAIVERALLVHGAPIYVRHEIVHNRNVVKRLCQKGSIFVDELHEIPEGSVVVFSAHGAPKAVYEEAKRRHLKVFDATCPLVTKVHTEVVKLDQEGYQIIMIGHEGHPEVEGTVGQVGAKIDVIESPSQIEKLEIRDPAKVAYVSQTTISHDEAKAVIKALRARFPLIAEPKKEDICYATQNRQDAVKKLAQVSDLVLVVGSVTSSNSNRLREVAEKAGCRAYLLDDANGLNQDWFKNIGTVGITAGASAPEDLVLEIVRTLQIWGGEDPENIAGAEENVKFPLPKGLWKSDVQKAMGGK